MNTDPSPPAPSYPLADLCVLVDLPPRTVRYYVQMGLVDRPQGETRAAERQPPEGRADPRQSHAAGGDQKRHPRRIAFILLIQRLKQTPAKRPEQRQPGQHLNPRRRQGRRPAPGAAVPAPA